MKKFSSNFVVTILVISFIMGISLAAMGAEKKVVINSYMADPAPKETLAKLVEKFEEEHPDFNVTINTYPHEDYKTLIRTWLPSKKASPDIVTWFAGERANTFVEKDLIMPLNEIWGEGKGFEDYFPRAFKSISQFDGKTYFLPQSWYWWGFWYRKSVFNELNLEEPITWNQFLDVCEKLKENGYAPITIGSKFRWTAAGWFDYLNLRVNGADFHMKLMKGEVSYDTPEVRKVFEHWKELIDKGYFIEDHTSYSWQEGAKFLFNKEAGMYLMGQFIQDVVSDEKVKQDLDFFRFPIIDASVPIAEETPTDGYMIPKNAPHPEAAKEFMHFLATRSSQWFFAEELNRIAANKNIEPEKYDPMVQKGLRMINRS
ncbi:carbohydrate ABC transporter substrate-binding protein, partial [Candidatus Bipolaricaulota bacterium]|nr:carbohydrate ABC transporter substrate-binding protein [Candidatus Bipolaricaulota bacterium]